MYFTLKSKPFIHKQIDQSITTKDIQQAISACYDTTAFSTFPYIYNGIKSRKAIKTLNSGNCIALALYIKNYLKKKGIVSFLIPATIFKSIQKEGYLDLAHVAVAIPVSSNHIMIVDIAFYLLEPIHVYLNKKKLKTVQSIDIGTNNILYIQPTHIQTQEETVYNPYQRIPKNSHICNCTTMNRDDENWSYILREILNPDTAISTFFIAIRTNPFIVQTKIEDGVCVKDVSIYTHGNDHVSISKRGIELYNGSAYSIPEEHQTTINQALFPYFKQNVTDVLKNL